MSTPDALLNPLTPLAFLTPEEAYQVRVAIYVLVAPLAIFVWDFVNNVKDDLRLVTRDHFTPFTIVYFTSRFTTLAYLLAFAMLLTAPLGHCNSLPHISVLYLFSLSSTTFLPLYRLCSLYSWHKVISSLFFVLWLSIIGVSTTPILGISASNIGTTDYCMISRLEDYVSLGFIIPFVFYVFVCFAAGWRLLAFAKTQPPDPKKKDVQVTRLEQYLFAFRHAVVEDGQVYYLAIIITNIITMTLFLTPSLPLVLRSVVHVPNLVVMNTLASHVYRQVRFGEYIGGDSDPLSRCRSRDSMTTIVFARMPPLSSDTRSGLSSWAGVGSMVGTGTQFSFKSKSSVHRAEMVVELPGLGAGRDSESSEGGRSEDDMV